MHNELIDEYAIPLSAWFDPLLKNIFYLLGPLRRASPMIQDVHALRYAVYCKEKGFLDAKNYPDGREQDVYDDYSVNFAAYSKTGEIVGTVRMVIPKPGQRFPYQDFCEPFPSVVLPPVGKTAEISRLIITPQMREQADKSEFGFSSLLSRLARRGGARQQKPEYTYVAPAVDLSTSPRLLLGMFRKMYRYSKENEITHWYASMERPLARMLTRMHFSFHQISAQVDYYGPVSLYLANIEELERTLEATNPTLLTWFRKSRSDIPPVV
jgi:N-acyl amino acid synthase of PEP-CTERM/exosortase system